MKLSILHPHRSWALLPLLGSMAFVLLYGVAAHLYPGGSNWDPTSEGFSWMHNYWCDLTGKAAKNGMPNAARPLALAGLAILCFSHAVFWFFVPALFPHFAYTRTVRWTGVSAMVIAGFHFTGLHDMVIDIASLLSAFALCAVFIGLYKRGWMGMVYMGIFFILLMIADYLVYLTGYGLYALPVMQKVTFLVFLVWVSAMNIRMYRFVNL